MHQLNTQRILASTLFFLFSITISFSMETECGDGIDNDGDGLVDCLDMDCSGSSACCGEDTDNDGLGDFCDMDDDNDGIPDDKECPPDTLMINAEIHDWVAIGGADSENISVGNVFVVREHYMDSEGQMFDLRFQLIGKYSQGIRNEDAFRVNFSNAKGVQIVGANPADSDYITYSLSWVIAGSVTDSNVDGTKGTPFEFAEITIFDLDNSTGGGYTDVGFFINDNMDIRNFQPGSEVDVKDMWQDAEGNPQFAYGLTNIDDARPVDTNNPCDGCQIKASIPNFTGAILLHGVNGTREASFTRQAQWRFRVARCPDFDGDGLNNLVDKDSDDDGCEDAIEGSLAFSKSDLTENGCLTGGINSETGIPLLAGDCQFVGTSQNATMQDSLCCNPSDVSETATICVGTSVTIFGMSFSSSTEAPVFVAGEGECGINLSVTINFFDTEELPAIERSICDGANVDVNGVTYTEAGTFSQDANDSNGCATTQSVIITLAEAEELAVINRTICEGGTTEVNGTSYNMAGTFTQDATGSNGCPTIQTVVVTVADMEALEPISRTICEGESIEINGTSYNTTGTFTQETTGTNGCLTTQSIIISVADSEALEPINTTICEGQTTTIGGVTYDAAGTYTQEANGSNGCTTSQTVIITVSSSPVIDTTIRICPGDERVIYGMAVDAPGTFVQILPEENGCDTTVNIVVTQAECRRSCCDRMGNNKIRITKRTANSNHVLIRLATSPNVILFSGEVPDEDIYLAFEAFSLVENNFEQTPKRKRQIIETVLKGQKIEKNSDLLTNFDTHTELFDLLEYSYFELNLGESFEL